MQDKERDAPTEPDKPQTVPPSIPNKSGPRTTGTIQASQKPETKADFEDDDLSDTPTEVGKPKKNSRLITAGGRESPINEVKSRAGQIGAANKEKKRKIREESAQEDQPSRKEAAPSATSNRKTQSTTSTIATPLQSQSETRNKHVYIDQSGKQFEIHFGARTSEDRARNWSQVKSSLPDFQVRLGSAFESPFTAEELKLVSLDAAKFLLPTLVQHTSELRSRVRKKADMMIGASHLVKHFRAVEKAAHTQWNLIKAKDEEQDMQENDALCKLLKSTRAQDEQHRLQRACRCLEGLHVFDYRTNETRACR